MIETGSNQSVLSCQNLFHVQKYQGQKNVGATNDDNKGLKFVGRCFAHSTGSSLIRLQRSLNLDMFKTVSYPC